MQAALVCRVIPTMWVLLPFMLAGPCFGVAAALLLAWHGELALVSRWIPGIAHLIALGFLTMPLAGMLAVQLARQTALVSVCALGLGTALLAGASDTSLLTGMHATWGLVGWVIVLTATVSFQLIPMFQGTPTYPRLLETWLPPLLFLLLSGWSAARLAASAGWRLVAELGIAAVLLAYAAVTLVQLRRRRKKPDTGTRYWTLAMASLALAAVLHFMPLELLFIPADALPLLTGVLVLVGCAMSAVNGMLYKIVPFLVWHHLQQDERLARERVPKMSAVLGESQAARQWRWHLAGLSLLVLAAIFPAVLARPAGLFLLVALLLLARDMASAVLLYARLRRP